MKLFLLRLQTGIVFHHLLFLTQCLRTAAFAVAPRVVSWSASSRSKACHQDPPSAREFTVGGSNLGGKRRDAQRPGSLRAQAEIGARQETFHEEQVEEEASTERQGFDWRRQWYPVAVMRDLEAMDPRQPYPVKVLGEAMVVWKEPRGGWRVFTDRCPHRWAPLSEGRVDQETGRLQCIYHGWEFEADGGCGKIPQADPEVRDTAQSSKRACATVIPSRVEHDLLWVWPDASPEGVENSERTSPVCVPEMESPDFGGEWYSRDLPYGYDTLVENLVDPAHLPYAHHGVIGARPMGTPMAIAMEKGLGEDVLRTQQTGYAGSKNMVVGYDAPSLVFYRSDYTDIWQGIAKSRPFIRCLAWIITTFKLDKRMAMKPEERKSSSDRLYSMFIGYAVPTSPGKSRVFIRNCRNFFLQHPVIPRRWRNSLASEHLGLHLVLDGDTPAVHMQERFLLKAGKHGGASAERTYFMPADSDEPIRAFRKWYNSRAGGGPAWAEGVDPSDLGPILPRESLLERMQSHTKHCSACSKAYRVSGQVKRASVGGALVLVASAAVAPRGPLALCLAGAAVAVSALAAAMARREQKHVFVDYVHATRDG